MKQFTYTIRQPLGFHARPAGGISKLARSFIGTTVTVEKDGKTASAAQLMRLMTLGAKQGDTVTVTIEGGDEEGAAEAMESFFQENL